MKSSWELVLYYSDEVFQTEKYDDDAIKKESKIAFTQVGRYILDQQINIDLQNQLLNDKTDML